MEKMGMTAEVLQDILADLRIEIRYNEMIHREEITDIGGLLNESEQPFDILVAYICDKFREEYKYCNKAQIEQSLMLIASNNPYNPILDDIRKCARQGVDGDYIGEISHRIMNIPANDDLSHVLIFKWFLQAVALLQNSISKPFGAEGMLVLKGSQGIGKSLFCGAAAIDSKYYRSIGFNPYMDETDVLSKANGIFIGEFSELEKSLKLSTLDFFKAFITSSKDSYRPKYGRTICDYIRRSSYIATCNTDSFLFDKTGNRRFWVVPCVERFNVDRLARCVNGEDDVFTMAYAQAYRYLQENGVQSFRLTESERERLEERNSKYMSVSECETMLKDILMCCTLKEFTIDQLKGKYSELSTYDNSKIGRILTNSLSLPQHIKKINNNGKATTQRVYQNKFGIQ